MERPWRIGASLVGKGLTHSPLPADIQAFGQFQVFCSFEYLIFDELSYNFSRFYGFKQSFFMIYMYKLPSNFFSIYKSMCMF